MQDKSRTTEDEISDLEIVSCEDIDESHMRPRLISIFWSAIGSVFERDIHLESIHIVGSFATATAKKVASDLDIRYVVSEEITDSQAERFREHIINHWRDQFSGVQIFGYIDAWLSSDEPPTQSYVIYSV